MWVPCKNNSHFFLTYSLCVTASTVVILTYIYDIFVSPLDAYWLGYCSDRGLIVCVNGMTHLVNILLKFPIYNLTKVALKWTDEWADFRFYTDSAFRVVGEPLSSSTVALPSIPAYVSLWWIALWAAGRPTLSPLYWQSSYSPLLLLLNTSQPR